MSLNYNDSQSIYIDREFRDDLRKVIRVIEESKSQNEFQISVGKLVGMVHFIANMKFQSDMQPTFVGEVAAPAYPTTSNVEVQRDNISIPVRR